MIERKRSNHAIRQNATPFNNKLLILFLISALSMATFCTKGPALQNDLKLGGDFTLTDMNGKPFHLQDLRGKVVLLYFGYTLCPDACPFTLSKIHRVYSMLGDRSSKIQTIFVSVDPDRDKPEKLVKYLAYYDVGAIGLTGTPEEIAKVAKQYQVVYRKVDSGSAAGYLMDHSTYTYLIDAEGKVRYRFKHSDGPPFMASVIRLLVP